MEIINVELKMVWISILHLSAQLRLREYGWRAQIGLEHCVKRQQRKERDLGASDLKKKFISILLFVVKKLLEEEMFLLQQQIQPSCQISLLQQHKAGNNRYNTRL